METAGIDYKTEQNCFYSNKAFLSFSMAVEGGFATKILYVKEYQEDNIFFDKYVYLYDLN